MMKFGFGLSFCFKDIIYYKFVRIRIIFYISKKGENRFFKWSFYFIFYYRFFYYSFLVVLVLGIFFR